MTTIRVASAQINTTVGDIAGNCKLIAAAIDEARSIGADIVAFPELAITGYPPEDLLLSEHFVRTNRQALDELAQHCTNIAAMIGIVDYDEDENGDIKNIFNAAAIIVNRQIVAIYHKNELPNYGVFDELRYFTPGTTCQIIDVNGIAVGVNICEDIWVNPGVGDAQCVAGAQLILTLNSSPYEIGKLQTRINLVTDLAKRHQAYAIYTNQVGGQDELVFDGSSIFAGPQGETLAVAPRFESAVTAIDIELHDNASAVDHHEECGETSFQPTTLVAPRFNIAAKTEIPSPEAKFEDDVSQVYAALTLGTRDYIHKTGFQKVAIALSGGIDSSIVACIAADAIGSENIVGVGMPSRYSSEGSLIDAQDLADRLRIPLWRIPIEPAHAAFEQMLAETFRGHDTNTAEENVQSRIRGNVMMTIANKFGWLVLTTGNKSEMATGYATLYGDMAGGFAVIKDIPKQLVYQLSEYRNSIDDSPPIPRSVIDKPPTAELRPDQLDVDSLPPYDQLDPLLRAYVEERRSSEEILEELDGIDHATAARILRMVDINEYKRRQSPPGVKVTGLAFGRDRRMPIASRWRH
ncbi:MAG: NAD+ synthase [Chloroflexi bacterium]|nr:NAD+ synthase [Chloroflexota bacterium]